MCVVPSAPGEVCFLLLPRLEAGAHKLTVAAISHSTSLCLTRIGQLEILVRPPQPWDPAVGTAGLLAVTVDPPDPMLEELWDGHVSLEIRGPLGARVRPTISFFEKGKNVPCFRKRLPPLQLPVAAEVWQLHFDLHFRGSDDVKEEYDAAHSCVIELDALDLGPLLAHGREGVYPLRWIARTSAREQRLRPHR